MFGSSAGESVFCSSLAPPAVDERMAGGDVHLTEPPLSMYKKSGNYETTLSSRHLFEGNLAYTTFWAALSAGIVLLARNDFPISVVLPPEQFFLGFVSGGLAKQKKRVVVGASLRDQPKESKCAVLLLRSVGSGRPRRDWKAVAGFWSLAVSGCIFDTICVVSSLTWAWMEILVSSALAHRHDEGLWCSCLYVVQNEGTTTTNLLLPASQSTLSINHPPSSSSEPAAAASPSTIMSSSRFIAGFAASVRSVAPRRAFQTSRVLGAGKESALHNENRAEEAEAHKQDQLAKQKQGKGEWKDALASDSESIVKADRGDLHNAKDTIATLQKESAEAAQKDQKR
nr:hypothetical protein CFP56_11865 [Quercus suber]